jgi:hypothetical protein
MKNLFKLLSATLVLIAFGTSTYAQNSATTNASINSTLMTTLDIKKNTDIEFGQIATGTIPNMNALTGEKTNVGSNATLGKFTVSGTAKATVKVNYDVRVDLKGPGKELITFSPSVYRTAKLDARFGTDAIASDATYSIASEGSDLIFVGGTVAAFGTSDTKIPALSTELLTGTYSGTFNITATYN